MYKASQKGNDYYMFRNKSEWTIEKKILLQITLLPVALYPLHTLEEKTEFLVYYIKLNLCNK